MLNDALSEVFEQEASPVEGQSLQKIRKGEKGKGETNKKPKDIGHFFIQNFFYFLHMPKQIKS